MVPRFYANSGSNLKFPLTRGYFRVNATYSQPGMQTSVQMGIHYFSPECIATANAAIILPLNYWLFIFSIGLTSGSVHQKIFLLQPIPWFQFQFFVENLLRTISMICRMRLSIGQICITKNDHIVALSEWTFIY